MVRMMRVHRYVALFLFSTILLWGMPVHAEIAVLYSQSDSSGEMLSQQATFQETWIESASLGNLILGKDRLSITFTMKDQNAGNIYHTPTGVAIKACSSGQNLQTYHFTDADRTLLSDGTFHTFTVQTETTTLGIADGETPICITFFGLSQRHNSTHLKSNAAGTIPYLVIEGTTPPPPVIPQAPEGAVTVYTQEDKTSIMTNPQATYQDAHIDSAGLGNLNLGQGKVYITFMMKDPRASNVYRQPDGVALGTCFGCRDLQKYSFTDTDRTLLSDQAFHTFVVETGTTTSAYADGTRPVFISFFNLPQYQYNTKVKSNAAQTIPYLIIQKPVPPDPCATPGACASNVLFLSGIKASVLKIGSDTVWPPTVWSDDVPQLALNGAGESVNDVRVAGVVNSFYGTPIYGPFSAFMDGLVDDGTIDKWLPLAYDWRLMPEKVLNEGIKTPDGVLDVIGEIEELAANSKSGKVAIVAHSMGGLLGKAIIKRLSEQGKGGLISAFVMVGSPQLGTPQAISSLLHGGDEGIAGGVIVKAADARAVSQNMPSVYNLLPSPSYFGAVTDSVIRFNADADFTKAWSDFWGGSINLYESFFQFMTGQGVARQAPSPGTLRVPTVVSTTLMAAAADFHNVYDGYQIPQHIRVVQVAGWGRPTVKAVEYKTNHFLQSYGTMFTREGDGTVVYPSAVSSDYGEKYFFNLFAQNKLLNSNTQHRDLFNTNALQTVVSEIIRDGNIATTTFVTSAKPLTNDIDDQLVVSTHSPVILGAYDSIGNFTGVDQNQDLSADVLIVSENIPGSAFLYTSEDQNIFLPKDGSYRFVYKGVGNGPTTVAINNFSGDVSTPVAQFSDIPTSPTTGAEFTVSGAAPEETVIAIDADGDSDSDLSVSADGKQSISELIALFKMKVSSLNIKDKLKKELMKKIAHLEKKIEQNKKRNAKILSDLKEKISKREMKGKVEAADADEILAIIELLEAQSDGAYIDTDTLAQLKAKITSLNLKKGVKNDLLKRIDRLENKKSLAHSLSELMKKIERKGVKGKIPDTDVQVLINLLGKIESAL